MKSSEIRQSFIDYFVKNNHHHMRSAPVVPSDDPTMLFTAAGMVPLKKYFINLETPPFKNVVTSQKCIRAGGKHNDLENVGYTKRHHTFFEMLGNFSFGGTTKEMAMNYAWDYIVNILKINPDRLYFTVHSSDQESRDIWKKITNLPDDKIITIDSDDNFWSMGNSGPCGPCTEIFYDYGDILQGGLPGSPDEGDRYVEIWNIVFMEYIKQDNGKMTSLGSTYIDTGMGLERISSVIQGKTDNFDTDIFVDLISAFAKIINVDPRESHGKSFRVIADHIRSISFIIADGVTPSNEGRGYVLRRIIRRATRHAYNLGVNKPSLYLLAEHFIALVGSDFKELLSNKDTIISFIKSEEESFIKTISSGSRLLESHLSHLTGSVFSGEVAFKLYDTYGFPIDLTQDLLRDKNISVDMQEFEDCMKVQKAMSKKEYNYTIGTMDQQWFDLLNESGPTEFLGYSQQSTEAKLLFITRKDEDSVYVVLDKTTLYGESGGQISDNGTLEITGVKYTISDVQKRADGKIFVHTLECPDSASININDKCNVSFNPDRRKLTSIHHSATHLLNAALRSVLGSSISQKGSWVGEDKLRFDFNYSKPVTDKDIEEIESIVNHYIMLDLPVHCNSKSYDDAIEDGATYLMGESYSDIVRVVSMGSNKQSVELCGGTHVSKTSEIGAFHIIKESSVASGIRRIEACCAKEVGIAARNYYNILSPLSKITKESFNGIQDKLVKLTTENKQLKQDITNIQVAFTSKSALDHLNDIQDKSILYKNFDCIDNSIMRLSANAISDKFHNTMVILTSSFPDRVIITFNCFNSPDNIEKLKTIKESVVSALSKDIKGGGNKNFYQYTVSNIKSLSDVCSAIERRLNKD